MAKYLFHIFMQLNVTKCKVITTEKTSAALLRLLRHKHGSRWEFVRVSNWAQSLPVINVYGGANFQENRIGRIRFVLEWYTKSMAPRLNDKSCNRQ